MTAPASRPTKESVLKDFRTNEILEAAEQVIAEVGYADASMDRIAQQANVAKGTLYRYFQNKEELLAQLYARSHAVAIEEISNAIKDIDSYQGQLRQAVFVALKISAARRRFYLGLYQEPQLGLSGTGAITQQLHEQAAAFIAILDTILKKGIQAGEFRVVNTHRVASFLYQLFLAVLRESLERPDPPNIEDDTNAIFDFF